MEQTPQPISPTPAPPPMPKRSLGALIKKHWLFIIVFFIVAITSGVVMADHEAKSIASWKTYTSKEAGLSFKHPSSYKIVEDKGWRITVYPSEATPANNIKILYGHKNSAGRDADAEATFLANCQAKRVSEIDANTTRIKVYEDSTCGGQTVANSILVYSENDMNYDIGLFGETDRDQLYQFLSTFTFSANATAPTMEPIQKQLPSKAPEITEIDAEGKMCGGIAAIQCPTGYECVIKGNYPDAAGKCTKQTSPPETIPTINEHPTNSMTVCTMDAMICPDGTTVGRSGPKCEFVCPK